MRMICWYPVLRKKVLFTNTGYLNEPSTLDRMSFVVSGLVPQMSHNFDCNAGNGIAFCIPTRAKILTRGIVTVSVNSMVCICNLLTLMVVEVEGGRHALPRKKDGCCGEIGNTSKMDQWIHVEERKHLLGIIIIAWWRRWTCCVYLMGSLIEVGNIHNNNDAQTIILNTIQQSSESE